MIYNATSKTRNNRSHTRVTSGQSLFIAILFPIVERSWEGRGMSNMHVAGNSQFLCILFT